MFLMRQAAGLFGFARQNQGQPRAIQPRLTQAEHSLCAVGLQAAKDTAHLRLEQLTEETSRLTTECSNRRGQLRHDEQEEQRLMQSVQRRQFEVQVSRPGCCEDRCYRFN